MPTGFRESAVQPDAAYFSEALGEFFAPYDAVRTAADPEALARLPAKHLRSSRSPPRTGIAPHSNVRAASPACPAPLKSLSD